MFLTEQDENVLDDMQDIIDEIIWNTWFQVDYIKNLTEFEKYVKQYLDKALQSALEDLKKEVYLENKVD